jgi:hypothetical protein
MVCEGLLKNYTLFKGEVKEQHGENQIAHRRSALEYLDFKLDEV